MNKVHLDFETASTLDLTEVGSYRYAIDPSTRVLMLAWALDNDRPRLCFPGDQRYGLDPELEDLLDCPDVEIWAFHAAFERLIFKHVMKRDIPIPRFRCAQVLARYHSLPSNLAAVGEILNLAHKKLDGGSLVKMFCEPYIVAQDRPLFGRTPAVFLDEYTNPVEWNQFCDYALGDVEVERQAVHFLDSVSPLPRNELENYWMDQEINDRGIPVDIDLIEGALQVIGVEKQRLVDELRAITGLENPNSDTQVLSFVQSRGYPFQKIGKDFVRRALGGEGEITEECRRVLLLRTQLAKSSVDKFDAFEKSLVDNRVHHQFKFMGAARTGRFSGAGLQFQNLLRPVKELEDDEALENAIRLLTVGDVAGIRLGFKSSVLDVVASCIRPAFKAPDGFKFYIADLSQIESVIAGWLSGCKRILKVYTSPAPYNDAYKDFAVDLYNKPYDAITKAERNICKPSCLGCGYGMGPGEEIQNDDGDTVLTGLRGYAAAMGIAMTQAEADRSVKIFREKFPEIVRLWSDFEKSFILAIEGISTTAGKCKFEMKGEFLRVQLPSGRYLHYLKPRVTRTQALSRSGREYTKTTLYYWGQDAKTHQWVEIQTRGAALFENADQATARDVLLEGMRRATEMGFDLVAHVHDEIVALAPLWSMLEVEDLEEAMAAPVSWAFGLPLKASGFSSTVYKKGG